MLYVTYYTSWLVHVHVIFSSLLSLGTKRKHSAEDSTADTVQSTPTKRACIIGRSTTDSEGSESHYQLASLYI